MPDQPHPTTGTFRPTNLPLQLTSFVGRQLEIAEVERLLGTTRCLTLTGPGGVGKTRLALQVATRLLPRFAHGVWTVDLAPVSEAHLVPQAIAQTLAQVVRVHKEANQAWLSTLITDLKDRQMLLVLDNCEHLVTACAEVAAALLRACATLSLLATSREALGMEGELVWQVPSLSVPPTFQGHHALLSLTEHPEQLRQFEAAQLFLERAQARRADFCLTPHNALALIQICQRLDGIPLALELASARVQVLSLEQIAARLENRFGLLTGGNRTALPRQQTLRATLDWSHDLLRKKEQVLLRRLAVFAGGWTLEAAEGVCCGRDASEEKAGDLVIHDILEVLAQLVNKSLVTMEEHEPQARYRLLETVRQYAREKVAEAGEAEWMRRRHLDSFLTLVQTTEPKLLGTEQAVYLRRLKREHANLRAAFEWSLEERSRWEDGLHLAAGLWSFWYLTGQIAEGCDWLEEGLKRTEPMGSTVERAQALLAAGHLVSYQKNDFSLARRLLEESRAIWSALGHPHGIALALSLLGINALYERDLVTARQLLEENMAMLEWAGEQRNLTRAQGILALCFFEQGDYRLARQQMEHNLARARVLGDPTILANSLNHLGELTRFEGDFAQAERLYQESLLLFQEVGNVNGAAMLLGNLSQVALARGAARPALALGLDALNQLLEHWGRREHIYGILLGLTGPLLALHFPTLAAQVCGAAEAFREKESVLLNRTDQAQYDRDVTVLQSHLTEASLQVAWAEGRKLIPEQVVVLVEHLALPEQAEQDTIPSASRYPADLTAREVEVLRLLAQGLTNKQIAEYLILSPKTISSHLAAIFSKIGVNTRSAATRFAAEHTLL